MRIDAAILAAPDDDAPRLSWAERVGGERGELVRVQCALARGDLPRQDRFALVRRERELLAHDGRVWAREEAHEGGTFVRGFVERVRIPLEELAERGEALFERAPLVRSLELVGSEGGVNRYAGPTADEEWARIAQLFARAFRKLPEGRVRSLYASAVVCIEGDWSDGTLFDFHGDELLAIVASAAALQSLVSLSLGMAGVRRGGIPHLARLSSLRDLRVHQELGGAGCADLLRAVRSVVRFAPRSDEPKLAGKELEELLEAEEIARLTELDLHGNQLGEDDLVRLAKTPSLSRVERLGLALSRFTPRAIEALAHSPHLASVVELDLRGGLDDAMLRTLATAPFAPRLRGLRVAYAKLTSASLQTLRAFRALEWIDVLQVTGLRYQRDALEALVPEVRP